ncbi:MAG TPA: CHC2 zinc finger domain-containing protein [Actinomycetota bacterium]|nr:CHC2 zinc finger domain-containing protein [Actinomycetota bacterium]
MREMARPPISGAYQPAARSSSKTAPPPVMKSTTNNPWLATTAQCDDEALATWCADIHVVLADADGDDPASVSTREIASLMLEAVEREMALRRRAGVRKPSPTGGLPRDQAGRLRHEIRRRLDLVALVREDVPDLYQSGSSWRGRCPLCQASNPTTLTVWPGSGRWRCWRCGVGGDAVTWVLAVRPALDYRSALTYLAMRAGISLEKTVAMKGSVR